MNRGVRAPILVQSSLFMQRSPKLAASVSVSVPQAVHAAKALFDFDGF
jgi:hypothetical protein